MFLIVMENHNWSQIKAGKAPYIKSLLPLGAFAENYKNPPGNHPSLPNYIWFEAGSALGISDDANPSANFNRRDPTRGSRGRNAYISCPDHEADSDSLEGRPTPSIVTFLAICCIQRSSG